MKTLAYETPRGTLKVVRGEWIEETLWTNSQTDPTFRTEDGKDIVLVNNHKLVMIVTTPKGGRTERTIGHVA